MRQFASALAFALALAACGETPDLAAAGRNAAFAALEAADPEAAQTLRTLQQLRAAAAACGWRDVDATLLAETAVSGIEDPAVRAAAQSLVGDLLADPAPAAGAAETDCSAGARAALEAQVARLAGEEEPTAEAGVDAGER